MAACLPVDMGFDVGVTDDSSNIASMSSTPPTTVADSSSLHSGSPKRDVVHVAIDTIAHVLPIDPATLDTPAPANDSIVVPASPANASPSSTRPRRNRTAVKSYNLVQLSGTAGHGKRRAKGDIVADRRRRTISGPTLTPKPTATPNTRKTVHQGIDALDLHRSLNRLDSPRTRHKKVQETQEATPRRTTRLSGPPPVAPLAQKPTNKRSRKSTEKSLSGMSRELRRLQDTKEFAGIDDKPVLHTIWSNGKYIDPNAVEDPPTRSKAKKEAAEEEKVEAEPEPAVTLRKRRVKMYEDKGLYAGQETPIDISKGLTPAEKKALAQLPELIPSGRVNKIMPLPMFSGLRTLIAGRDFKLPYNVCNPLPPGQPKPDEWKKMTKSMRPQREGINGEI